MIIEERGKVCFQTADTCDVQSNSNFRLRVELESGIYFRMSRENIAPFSPVGDVVLFDSNRGVTATFPGIFVSNCTKALNTWNTTRDSEDAGMRKDTTEKARINQTPR